MQTSNSPEARPAFVHVPRPPELFGLDLEHIWKRAWKRVSNSSRKNHHVTRKPGQPRAVSLPGTGGSSGDARLSIQLYTLDRGVAVVGEAGSQARSQGAFELEAVGRTFIFDPLEARHADWVVSSVECDVAPIRKAFELPDQKNLAKVVGSNGHGQSPWPTVILALPQGIGKTTLAPALMRRLNCLYVVDEWYFDGPMLQGGLHLTSGVGGVDLWTGKTPAAKGGAA